MNKINVTTITKIGCLRRKLRNGLGLIISKDELSSQFNLYGALVDRWARDRNVTFMPIMHGAGYAWQRLMAKMSEDSRHLERVLVAQSYGEGQIAQPVKIYGDWLVPAADITGRDIVLVDDILDSGNTMQAAINYLKPFEPASIQTFFMLRKNSQREALFVNPTWVMFDIDDCWIVGAGLDHCGKFRHLRYVAEVPQSSQSPLMVKS